MNKPHKVDHEYSPKEYKEIQSLLQKVDILRKYIKKEQK